MSRIGCIVLPTYNEAENVRELIPAIFEESGKISTHDLHVLIVDDSSPDGTAGVVRELMGVYPRLHLISGEKRGLGEAYKRGITHALKEFQPELIFEMDADLQHDPAMLPLFVTLANSGFSLVIGSRFISGGMTPNFGWYRKFISHIGTRLVRLFGGIDALTDCTSGYRCLKADVLAKCTLGGLATRGYSFQSALLCEMIRNGARVIEVPIVFQERKRGKSKLSLPDQIEFVINLLRLRMRSFTF